MLGYFGAATGLVSGALFRSLSRCRVKHNVLPVVDREARERFVVRETSEFRYRVSIFLGLARAEDLSDIMSWEGRSVDGCTMFCSYR